MKIRISYIFIAKRPQMIPVLKRRPYLTFRLIHYYCEGLQIYLCLGFLTYLGSYQCISRPLPPCYDPGTVISFLAESRVCPCMPRQIRARPSLPHTPGCSLGSWQYFQGPSLVILDVTQRPLHKDEISSMSSSEQKFIYRFIKIINLDHYYY